MGFSLQCILHCFAFVGSILPCNLCLILIELIFSEPFSFLFLLLWKNDCLFTVLVNVFHKVYTGLILSSPLGFSSLPLLNILILDKLVNHLLILSFLIRNISVVFLKLNNLISTSLLFSSFQVLHLFLSMKSSTEQFLISNSILLLSLLSQLLFSSIMVDELKIPFAIEKEFLLLCSLFPLFFICPLLFEHFTFLG